MQRLPEAAQRMILERNLLPSRELSSAAEANASDSFSLPSPSWKA